MKWMLCCWMIMLSAVAAACPVCSSVTGRQIRARLGGPDLVFNLAITALPFVIFALIIYLIYRGYPAKSSSTAGLKNIRHEH